jgi:hypothetical protein
MKTISRIIRIDIRAENDSDADEQLNEFLDNNTNFGIDNFEIFKKGEIVCCGKEAISMGCFMDSDTYICGECGKWFKAEDLDDEEFISIVESKPELKKTNVWKNYAQDMQEKHKD